MVKSLNQLFTHSVEQHAKNPFLLEKPKGATSYITYNYQQIEQEVHQFAAGLISLGIKKGDRVALLSEGCKNWVVAELGILFAGAVNVPLSVKLTEAEDIKFRLEHSGSKAIIVSPPQYKKINGLHDQVPGLEKVITYTLPENCHSKDLKFDNIKELGKQYLEKDTESFNQIWQAVTEDDFANICYTSGTTADPKGIILTHKNYLVNVEQSKSNFVVPKWYTTLIMLPWDHAFAHTAGIYTLISAGASFASVQQGDSPLETLKNVPNNIKEIRPHFMFSVPALAKNFKKNIENGIRTKGKMARVLLKWGLALGYYYNGIGWNKGKGLRILIKPLYKLFDTILFKKIRENFGGRMLFFVGGGALLDLELQRFFYAIGIPMFQGYGLTEASPVISSSSLEKHKLGSSGLIVSDLEVKICDDEGNELPIGEKGEIVVRGGNIMAGYWKNEEATKEAIKDGWLHTGDMGSIDNDNFLYVFGRFKSLLIADDGEKYSPEGIEEAFINHSPYIEQCMLYNNQDPYTIALIVPSREALLRYTKDHHLDISNEHDLEKILKLYESEMNHYRKHGKYADMFPHRWLPAAIGILSESFNEENKLMNSTLKIVRGKIIERYNDRIKYLYTPDAKIITNQKNLENLKTLLINR
ncbi:MAG: AMP-binding protein [Bacteroidales bacterium]|nr:AMP-binding protein [Bacteroidales bacterium]